MPHVGEKIGTSAFLELKNQKNLNIFFFFSPEVRVSKLDSIRYCHSSNIIEVSGCDQCHWLSRTVQYSVSAHISWCLLSLEKSYS